MRGSIPPLPVHLHDVVLSLKESTGTTLPSSLSSMLCSYLSPRHGASSSFRWRRRPPDMEGSCECIEYKHFEQPIRGGPLSRGFGEGLTNNRL
jgi:hypothetical protein